MKATGIVRKVDELGRCVIPKELRRTLGIEENDPVEMYVENESVVISKYKPINPCIITGIISSENMKLADGKITISKEGLRILEEEIKKLSEEQLG